MTMEQVAPYPSALHALILGLSLPTRPGWFVFLAEQDRGQGCRGLTLVVHITGPDAYHPERDISVNHLFPVPPAAYDTRSWQRWLFEQLRLVDLHELMETFVEVSHAVGCVCGVNDSGRRFIDPICVQSRPYAPSHGPGNDPYLVREVGSDLDQRTSFRGEVHP